MTAKIGFPKNELAQTVVVMATLAAAGVPLGAGGIAARFKPARNVRTAVGDVLTALRRMGQASIEDGRTFTLKRAA